MLNKQSIFGVSVITSKKEAILSFISQRLYVLRSSCLTIVTPNVEQIVRAQKDDTFRQMLNDADIALPDGKPLEWMLRKKNPKTRRISGVDFMVDVCRIAAQKKARVFFYGGREGVAKAAFNELKKTIPQLDGVAEDAPEFSDQNLTSYLLPHISSEESLVDHLVQTIRGRNIRIIFIGLGAPKQEYLMDQLKQRLSGNRVILMAVGGSFDFLAGKITRAPKIVQTIGFEWLWRLFQEPWRWRRQLALLEFIRLILVHP